MIRRKKITTPFNSDFLGDCAQSPVTALISAVQIRFKVAQFSNAIDVKRIV
ncbi:MAG: hypothetical protein L7T26_07110 [Pseudomonadales bacterium]|jgi:hypothetical protein|nr:hypothetical protein [Pseudomonadales bacterium]